MELTHYQRLLEKLNAHPKQRVRIFQDLPLNDQVALVLRLPKRLLRDIIPHLPQSAIIAMIEQLDPDEATDIIQLLPKHKQQKLIEPLSEEIRNSVEVLLEFDPNTAAGLMNLDYIQVEETETILEIAKQFRKHENRTGRPPVIIVMNAGHATGYLPGHELGFAGPEDIAKNFTRDITSISHTTSHKQILHLFRSHPHEKMVVLGDKDNVLGIIFSDDVIRILREKEGDTLYDFAGVSDAEGVLDTANHKIRSRYKWLIINLGTAFLASFTVSLFDTTISKYVLLAVYMPIVAGMGGNAATQTLAVMVRGIALKQITLRTCWRTLHNELTSGLVNGIINGAIVALAVMLIDHDVRIAMILASAMVVNLVVAAFFGTIIPLIMDRLGKDPASSATIFITTATDVLGFMVFLGLATLVLT